MVPQNKKTILYFLDIFPAISETFIVNEILRLERNGFNVIVFARKKEDTFRHGILNNLKAKIGYLQDGHNIKFKALIISHLKMIFMHPFNYMRTFIFAFRRKRKGLFWFFKISCFYADTIRKHRFSHIHSHFAAVSSCYAMLAAKILGKPFTFTIHGIHDLYITPPVDLVDRINAAKKVITISEYNKRYLIKKFHIPEEKIAVVHSGINLDYFTENSVLKNGEKIILSVARLHPVKGLDNLIKACGILDNKRIDFKCFIIGRGEEKDNLEKLINELNLNDKVFLLGAKPLEEVREFYKKATVFVLPSRQETMGVTTMEAMASGLPVISTNIYGIPELVEHRVSGFLVSPDNEKEVAFRIEKLLEDENIRARIGKMGRKKIEEKFSLETEINKLIEVCFK